MEQQHQLERGLSLTQGTAINMIDMVGIGPFITIPFIVGAMKGPQCLIAWLVGALLAFMDGAIWAEMGARWPAAGGSYVFLQKLYGKWGKMFAFLFIWQTTIQAPLVIASGAIGFSQYLTYLINLTGLQQKLVSGALVILLVLLLYRNIKTVGKISVILWIITGGTFIWLIASGFNSFNSRQAFTVGKDAWDMTPLFFVGLGQASLKTVYSFLGYYNVCHLGAEIKEPERNIPKSIFISIAGIAVLYLGMQIMILGVLPWPKIAGSQFVVSIYFEHIYNSAVARFATGLILIIALSSLFSVTLGYSRVPYAAAIDGNFFKIFGKVHPTKKFPHVSLLILGGFAFVFSLLFKMKEIITAIVTMRIIIQFLGQAFGILLWHYQKPDDERPYKMKFFPIPAIIAIVVWLFILLTSPVKYIGIAIGIILTGLLIYYFWQRRPEADPLKKILD